MSNDFWGLSEGGSATDSATGAFDAGGGNMQPIPSETNLLAAIDEAKWDGEIGQRFISLRWAVLQPEEFENRKLFQKLWVDDADPRAKPEKVAAKRDKAKKMLAAIDLNAGGKLSAKPVLPSDEAMTLHLTNKPMILKVMEWKMKDAMTGEMKRGNWVGAVNSKASAKVSSSEEIANLIADQKLHEKKHDEDMARVRRDLDDSIPF